MKSFNASPERRNERLFYIYETEDRQLRQFAISNWTPTASISPTKYEKQSIPENPNSLSYMQARNHQKKILQ